MIQFIPDCCDFMRAAAHEELRVGLALSQRSIFLQEGQTFTCGTCGAMYANRNGLLAVQRPVPSGQQAVVPAGQQNTAFGRNHRIVPPANNFVLIAERPVSELDGYKEVNKQNHQKFLEEELPEQAPWAQKARK
jgi:hypothetical protein